MAIKNFGAFHPDDNRNPIPSASGFVTADATTVPQTSPLSYTNAVTTIVVPSNAAEIVVFPTTDMRISEVVGMTQYDVVAANTKEVFGCADLANIYITRDASSGSLRFRFLTV